MRIALALVIALAACGDSKKTPDDPMPDASIEEPTPDAMVDAPMEEEVVTLTSYVKDLITTGTSATAAPRPYSEFATLPDPDGAANNTTAYQSLFP